jgi:hypothetical protein
MEYALTYAGVPFCLDHFVGVRGATEHPFAVEGALERIHRLLPDCYLADLAPIGPPGRDADSLARQFGTRDWESRCRVGDWVYPYGACKWGVFKGLATSTQYKEMLASTKGVSARDFVMKAVPDGAGTRGRSYSLTSSLYMLPGRPLAEHGGQYDGLYLITLVDERYYWQGDSASLAVKQGDTWATLIESAASALGVSVSYSAVSADYGSPDADSQLASAAQNAALLLDALAYNTGRVVVRNLNGSYALLTYDESFARAVASRNYTSDLARLAGGDLFASGGRIKAGDLRPAQNSVVPHTVTVAFPKYVYGDDPVPHFLNPRTGTRWCEDGYGAAHEVGVPLSSGGSFVSGLSGAGVLTLRPSAKALFSGEAAATPLNSSGLTALAVRLAGDYYASQAASALDEVYEGTYAWTPDGLHDIVWTYSHAARGAHTRVCCAEWTARVVDFQQAVPLSGEAYTPRGAAGTSVAQTVRDKASGTLSTTLSSGMASGVYHATLASVAGLPTSDRWKGQVGTERVLFEAASNGLRVDIARRGIDGTLSKAWASGDAVSYTYPNSVYMANLLTFRGAARVFPGAYTSGGVVEAIIDAGGGGVSAPISDTLDGTDEDNYPVGGGPSDPGGGASTVIFTTTAETNVTGVGTGISTTHPSDGQTVTFYNSTDSSDTFFLTNGDAGSESYNRITTPSGEPYPVPVGSSVTLTYDESSTSWLVVSQPPAGLPYSPTLTGTNNNYSVPPTITSLTPTLTGATTLTGLADVPVGTTFWITNRDSSDSLTLANESGSSSVGNQFLMSQGTDLVLAPGESAMFIQTADGLVESGGSLSLSAGSSGSEETLAAAGSTQANSAQIATATTAVEVTGADGTKGVVLPDVEACKIVVWNNNGASSLKVWPPVGAKIDGVATNGNDSMTATSVKLYTRIKSTHWTYVLMTGTT